MFKDLDDLSSQLNERERKDRVQTWQFTCLVPIYGEPEQGENDEELAAELERKSYWSQLQPKSSWVRRTSRQAGRWLLALGQRLEGYGAPSLAPRLGASDLSSL